MRITIVNEDGVVFANHEVEDAELLEWNHQTLAGFLEEEVAVDVKAYLSKLRADRDKKAAKMKAKRLFPERNGSLK